MQLNFTLDDLKPYLEKASSSYYLDNPIYLQWNQFQKYMSSENETLNNHQMIRIKELGGFSNIKTVLFGAKNTTDGLVNKSLAKAIKKENLQIAKKKAITDAIQNKIDTTFTKAIYKVPVLPKKEKVLDRHLHLVISDLHFGSDLNPKTGVKAYGVAEESRSMARLALSTIDYKSHHRNNTKLFINILGDIIQGKIHEVHSSAKISEQICRAMYNLGSFIHVLAGHFPEIQVNCATGNHDRIPYIHHDRAASDKYDSYASIVYYHLKKQFENVPNVKFNIPQAPFFTYESFGFNYWCTHGDNQIRIPNPMGSINIGQLENEINKINARSNTPKYSVFVVGHIHTGMKISLKNGSTLITNPPLIPTDQYALSLNIDPEAPTGQQLWESVPGYSCGDSRTLWVTEEDRQNQSLDKIIPPFSGL